MNIVDGTVFCNLFWIYWQYFAHRSNFMWAVGGMAKCQPDPEVSAERSPPVRPSGLAGSSLCRRRPRVISTMAKKIKILEHNAKYYPNSRYWLKKDNIYVILVGLSWQLRFARTRAPSTVYGICPGKKVLTARLYPTNQDKSLNPDQRRASV